MRQVEIVEEIINKALENSGRVSKFFVIESIKNRVHPTDLFNKYIGQRGEDGKSGDGLRNIAEGAKKYFSDAIKNLRRRNVFTIDAEGWVTKVQPLSIEDRIEAELDKLAEAERERLEGLDTNQLIAEAVERYDADITDAVIERYLELRREEIEEALHVKYDR